MKQNPNTMLYHVAHFNFVSEIVDFRPENISENRMHETQHFYHSPHLLDQSTIGKNRLNKIFYFVFQMAFHFRLHHCSRTVCCLTNWYSVTFHFPISRSFCYRSSVHLPKVWGLGVEKIERSHDFWCRNTVLYANGGHPLAFNQTRSALWYKQIPLPHIENTIRNWMHFENNTAPKADMRQKHSQHTYIYSTANSPIANDALIESICRQKFYWYKITLIDFTASIFHQLCCMRQWQQPF